MYDYRRNFVSSAAIVNSPSKQMTASEYHAAPGLSNSGLRDFAVSPLRYWHLHVNPNRPKPEPTPFMEFGLALHAAVLEPDRFEHRYCQRLNAADIEGCLVTAADIQGWLKSKSLKPKGTLKKDLINQALRADPKVPIFDVLEAVHGDKNAGKVQFSKDDWTRIASAERVLRLEPKIEEILSDRYGIAEVSVFVTSADGIHLKARMDWVTPDAMLDLKTLTALRGRSFDKSVTNAIWYEGYYRQAYFYSMVRALASGNNGRDGPQQQVPFVIAFVESEEPHEVRIREFRPKAAGEVAMLWERARIEVQGMMAVYSECQKKFGERPWRYAQQREPLCDEEFPGLSYG